MIERIRCALLVFVAAHDAHVARAERRVEEGITGRNGGYNLIATTTNGPAFVSVDRTAVGFSAAKWTPLNYPGSTMTTGNTVYQNYGLGIFFGPGGLSLETSYVARIKP